MQFFLRFVKLLFRFTWHIIAFIIVLVLCFHFWFIHHSEKTIEDLISWASDGKLKTTIKKFRIDYFNNIIDIKDLVIVNTDSSSQQTSYRFTAKDFHLNIRSRWDLIFHKQLIIDSVVFNNPDIIVVRNGEQKKDTTNKKLLLAEELGNVYKAITQSLNVFNLQRFEINEGKVLITDAGNAGRAPFRLSHIFLSVDKFNVDTSGIKNNSTFIFSERILLRINNQNILLPDNKSNISFKELLIDSKEKLIRIINPAINILPSGEQKNSLIASAPLLNITGLDFNALYQNQLVKADSVFLQNPKGDLEIYINENKSAINNKKKTPLDSALKQLPIAINISHVVLQHGDALMHLFQGKKMTSFQTKNDNVSVAGIRINDTSGTVLDIDGFSYTARNYIGYTPDSIYRFGFDSLQFINSKIVLYHFTAATVKKTKAVLLRDYNVPRFEITGMDWFSFILDNHFKAEAAVLYNPVLNIEKNNFINGFDSAKNDNKKSIYQTLSVMDSIIDLKQLKIINGNFSFKQSNTLNLKLQKLNLVINADELTKARTINQLVNSVKQLSFDTATANNLSGSIFISKSNFNNKEKNLVLNKIDFNADNSNINVGLNGVSLKDFSFDNNDLEVNNIHWNEGIIHINEQKNSAEKPLIADTKMPAFLLNNISGNNTTFFFENKNITASLYLKTVSANTFIKETNKPIRLESLLVAGNNAKIILGESKISCNDFIINDQQKSFLQTISFQHKNNNDSISVHVPSFTFIPFINETIAQNTITVDSIIVHQPEIFFAFQKQIKQDNESENQVHLPKLNFNYVDVNNASVEFVLINKNEKIVAGSKKLSLNIQSILTQNENDLFARNILLNAENILIKNTDSISLKSNGSNSIRLTSFVYQANKDWNFDLAKIATNNVQYENLKAGKNQSIVINKLIAQNAIFNNKDLKEPLTWLINKSKASIGFDLLNWKNKNTNLLVNSFDFNQTKKQIVINSFEIDPGKSREEFIKNLISREDFMQASSAKIIFNGIEMENKIINISAINIDDALLNVYSDKLIKAGLETLQPLPAKALLKLPIPLSIKKINLNNMKVDYTELNEDTRQVGKVYFTNINGNIFNVQSKINYEDSLRINVSAKFLDTMKLHLQLNESYADSLTGLNLNIQLGPGDLKLLNPFLVPLTSMQAKAGTLDTMNLSAVGNDYFSHGNMHLYYHGLKAARLDSGNLQKKKFGTKLVNFFANAVAVRNNNTKRRADFHFVRLREKSSISYFLKMVVQGAAGSVAPVSKIIYRKEYKRAMKKFVESGSR
jgi:hypothetical protein